MGSRWPMPAGRREYPRRSFCRARSLLTSSRSSRAGARKSKCRAKDGTTATWRPYALPEPKAPPLSLRLPNPPVIAGQGTIPLEVLEEARDLDTLIVAIGGGGLISGIAIAARALRPGIRIIGVEPTGAPPLHDSLAAGCVVELTRLDTAAVTLAPRRSAEINFAIIRETVERVVLVEDRDMREAARWLWRELGVATELSGAAAVAALLAGGFRPAPGERICAIVCGSGTDGFEKSRDAGSHSRRAGAAWVRAARK